MKINACLYGILCDSFPIENVSIEGLACKASSRTSASANNPSASRSLRSPMLHIDLYLEEFMSKFGLEEGPD